MTKNILSKDYSKVLRALAILSILLHNWFHAGFSATGCNENTFSVDEIRLFISSIFWDGQNIIVETSSFIGWLGVAVFVFLTGYGTAQSQPPSTKYLQIKYIKRNWLKLFLLLFPLVIIYFGFDIVMGNVTVDTGKRFLYLTLLNNFIYPFFRCNPHINWYFGLTFQFYLFWGIFGKYIKNNRTLVSCGIFFLLGLYICMIIGQSDIISIYTHCFTGWFALFALGIWFAHNPQAVMFISKSSILVEITLAILSLFLMIVLNYTLELWLFLPFAPLVFFIVLGKLLLRVEFLSNFFMWIGELSACLFVCYPLSRFAVKSFIQPHFPSLILTTIVYICLVFIMAYCYNHLYKWLLYTFKVKSKYER